jgi:hypothetical protein
MPSSRLTRVGLVALLVVTLGALLVVTLGALAGCSNPFAGKESPLAANQNRAGRVLTAVETKTALPSVASIPVGWALAAKNDLRPKNTKVTVTPARCRPLGKGFDLGYLRATTKSYATYIKPQRAALGVGIGSHAATPPTFGGVRAALRTCKTFTINKSNEVVQVRVLPLHLPRLAQDTLVTRFAMRTKTLAVTYDMVRIRVGTT